MRALLSTAAALLFAAAALAAPDVQPATLSFDLPDGAIARIGAPEQRLRNEVYALAYSPDNKRIAVSIGYHIQILDAETGAEIKMLSTRDPRSLIRKVRFTADGKWLACQGEGNNQAPTLAQLWNVDEGKESDRLLKGEQRVRLALSPDGKTAVTLSRETVENQPRFHLTLWEALSGAKLRDLPLEGIDGIQNVRFSADGKRLIAQQERGGWKTLEIGRKNWSAELKEPPSTGSIYDYRRLSPDARYFIHGHSEGVGGYSQWTAHNIATGKPLGHLNRRDGVFLSFDPEGKRFLECIHSYDQSLFAWLPDLPGVFALKKVFSGSFGILRLCETSTAKVLRQWIVPMEKIRSVAFSPDGTSILVGHSYSLRKLNLKHGDETPRLGWWRYRSTDLRYSKDSRTLFVWESDGRCRTLCDPASSIVRGHLRNDAEMDAGTLKKRAENTQLRESKYEPGTAVSKRKTADEAPTFSVHRSPDGMHLIAFTQVQTGYLPGSGYIHYGPGQPVELWQANPLKKIASSAAEPAKDDVPAHIKEFTFDGFPGFGAPVAHSIGFSTDIRLYAWSEPNGTIHIWEIPSGRKRTPLKLEGVQGVGAFSRDRRLLAVGGRDDIRIFEIATGSVRLKLGAKMSPASGIAFSPDGSRLASSHHDTSILIWNAQPTMERGKSFSADDWNRCWNSLGDARAATALPAMQRLMAQTEQSVPRLRDKLLALTVPDPQRRIRELIDQMTDDTFRVRRDAEIELQRIDQPALAPLERTVKTATSEDLAMRSRKVIESIKSTFPAPPVERMQALRGVEVLEKLATADARAALRDLAQKASDPEIRRDATEALERLVP